MNNINYMFLIEVHNVPSDKVRTDIMNNISGISVGTLGTDLITVISHTVSTDAEAAELVTRLNTIVKAYDGSDIKISCTRMNDTICASSNTKTSVLIVEDQELVRKYLEDIVNDAPDLDLKYSISNSDLADLYCKNGEIDLILMDVYTDYGANGLEASARIKASHPEIKIIIVTSMPEFSYLERARSCGVDSFIYKELNNESILDVIRRTVEGENIYPLTTPEVILGNCSSKDLSYRELEVLRELTTGDSNEEIAERMHLSLSTVKTHITNLMQKTGFKSRTELAIKARESGLVIK